MYINPYEVMNQSNVHQLKANFHTHAGTGPGTCGAYDVEEVIKLYREAGYKVLTISNHDIYTNTQKFQGVYDMVLLNGFEYSQDKHMLCVDCNDVIFGTKQEVINQTNKDDGFVILCHPNWRKPKHWKRKEINSLDSYTGIEIYNGVIFRLRGTGLATNIWDYILSQKKVVWGFANDDLHRWYDLARSWNVIVTDKEDRDSVKNAIKRGSFYASTGLHLIEFSFDDNIIKIQANKVNTHIKKNTYIFIGKNGGILSQQIAEKGEYQLRGRELYVRVQVISEHGAMLWTQPVYNISAISEKG